MAADYSAAVRIYFTDGGTDTTVFTSLYDATTFAADSVDRVDVSKVTITDDRGVLTLTFKAH